MVLETAKVQGSTVCDALPSLYSPENPRIIVERRKWRRCGEAVQGDIPGQLYFAFKYSAMHSFCSFFFFFHRHLIFQSVPILNMGFKDFLKNRSGLRVDNSKRTSASSLTLRQSIWPLSLVTTLFFLWGFAYGLLDTLNKHFQRYRFSPESSIRK